MTALERRGDKWTARYVCPRTGARLRRTVGTVRDLGAKLSARRRREILDGLQGLGPTGGTLLEFLAAYGETHRARAPKSHEKLWHLLCRLAVHLPGQMRDVSVPIAEDALAAIAASGPQGRRLHPNTVRSYARRLGVAWQMAVDRGWAESNPWRRCKLPRPVQRPVPALTAEERARLLGACSALLRAFVGLLLETGLRLGEASALRWGDVDMGGGWLTVRRSKSGRPRTLKLTAAAHRILDELGDGVGPIFSTAPKLREFQLACAAADLPRLRFHDCRHIAAVRMARAGATVLEISKVLGHQTVTQSAYYAEHNPTELGASAIAKLDAHD